MKTRVVLGSFLILAGISVFGLPACKKKPFTPGYNPPESLFTEYDPKKEITFTGEIVQKVGLMRNTQIPSTTIQVRADDGREYLVALGPDWYLSMMGYKFLPGVKIEVTGAVYMKEMQEMAPDGMDSEDMFDEETPNDLLKIILARKIKKTNKAIKLRDKTGRPMWYKKGRAIGQRIYLEKIIKEKKEEQEKLKQNEQEKEKYLFSQ